MNNTNPTKTSQTTTAILFYKSIKKQPPDVLKRAETFVAATALLQISDFDSKIMRFTAVISL
jgi:hypothetical protein